LYGTFENFYTDKENHVLIDKTFEILSPHKLVIKFKPGTNPSLFNIDFPIFPKHIFEKIDRKAVNNSQVNSNPVTNGPFKLKKWERNQYIILEKNPKSFLTKDETINELVFKIVPEYNSRLSQLKTGEIDVMESIKTVDVNDLKKIEIHFIKKC
jgi:peptide/nickel transport system substrate-binding protein